MTGLRGRRTLRQRAPQHEARLRLVAAALAASAGERHPGSPPPHDASLADRIASVVDLADHDQVWLVLSTLSGVVAPHTTVVEVVREARRAGGRAVTDRLAACPHRDGPVTVAAARVLVDVTQAVHTDLVTGIQRVALRTVQGWQTEHDLDPVTWTADGTTLRTLTDVEASRLRSPAGSPRPTPEGEPSLVIPWRATVLIPELADQPTRLAGLDAVVRHGASHSAMIGYDCVPLMSPETVREGFVPLFYATLGVTSRVDHVATISAAATLEYEGWRESSAAVGLPGPRITTVELPEVEVPCDEHDVAEATALLSCGRAALVLAVGSHEPRKNHLNLLHAAELCWGRGDDFALAFVGGNAWGDREFSRRVAELQALGHPVRVLLGPRDALLGGAYRAARFTVFPSLSEGFGLPVAESLAAGTPVITSDIGSMREIASRGGALVVDPHDPRAIAAAMSRLLRDDALLGDLRAQAAARPASTWADYAARAWDALVTGSASVPSPSTQGCSRGSQGP